MLESIQAQLTGHPWAQQIHYLSVVDSTNTYAKRLACQGAPEGTVVIADHQTCGRGRLGRSFSSPSGMGLYMSVILRPNCPPEELMHLTCATGVAAGDAVTQVTGEVPHIKWTNDLILGRKKLGGILTEICVDENQLVCWAIIGIGINCCQRRYQFPKELRNIACSLGILQQEIPTLAAELIRQLHTMRQDLFLQQDAIMQTFQTRCITIGQEISLVRGDQVRHGKALDVDRNGGLIVAFADGHCETVTSGEVSIRGMYGYV